EPGNKPVVVFSLGGVALTAHGSVRVLETSDWNPFIFVLVKPVGIVHLFSWITSYDGDLVPQLTQLAGCVQGEHLGAGRVLRKELMYGKQYLHAGRELLRRAALTPRYCP